VVANKLNELALRPLTFALVQPVNDDQKWFLGS
jgi:hypothetical protein